MVAAHLVAEQAGAADLLTSAEPSYVHGMDLVLLVCGSAALVAALSAAAFLPSAPTAPSARSTGPDLATSKADARQ